MSMGGRAFLGGNQNHIAAEDACPVHWWAVGVAVVWAVAIVWCLPSCLSCTVGVGTPGLDLDTFSNYNSATGRDMSGPDASTWSLAPPNDVLLSSLPTPVHAGLHQVETTEIPSSMSIEEEVVAPPPSQHESPAPATSTGAFYFGQLPSEDEVIDAVKPEAPSVEDIVSDTAVGRFAELWSSMGDTAGDIAEIGFAVLAFLAASAMVLFIGNLIQGQGDGGFCPGADAANPLLFPGGVIANDAQQLHHVDASPPRRDTAHSMTSSSPHHLQHPASGGFPVSNSPFGGASPVLRLAATSPQALAGGPSNCVGPRTAPTNSPPVQIGAYYVANVGKEQRVVKTQQLNGSHDGVLVQEFVCSSSRSGIVFKGTHNCFELPVTNLLQGPFAMTAGRAPKHVCHMFESARMQPPACPTPSRAGDAGMHNRHSDLPSTRFKYPSAIRKMVELGFEDNSDLRSVLSSYGGDVNQALQEFWTE